MLIHRKTDKKAVALLLKYDPLAELYRATGGSDARKARYVEERGTAPAVLALLMKQGLAFEPVALDHDQAVEMCFEAYASCSKREVVDQFLASLSTGRVEWRAGLSAFAMMQSMPRHAYQESAAGVCAICSGVARESRLDLTDLNRQRFSSGTMAAFKTPYEIQFFLGQQAALEKHQPTADDQRIFDDIIGRRGTAAADTKPVDMAKELRSVPGLKLTLEQSRGILETLGVCGVLRTPKHPGYLTAYTNPGLAPSKSRNSDWAYPVDFWSGAAGVDQHALKFWFGAHDR